MDGAMDETQRGNEGGTTRQWMKLREGMKGARRGNGRKATGE